MLTPPIKVHMCIFMTRFKRNQVEEAILRTLNASKGRAGEVKLRLKRLLVSDRRLARHKGSGDKTGFGYAFYSQDAPGSGVEVMFSGYEAFALLAGHMLLEQGMPQATVVRIMLQLRPDLESAHREILAKAPHALFGPQAVQAKAKPGIIATDHTDPVFLALVKLPDSGRTSEKVRAILTVCRGHDELMAFIKKHSAPGMATTFFAFVGLMHRLAANLLKTRPLKRGRSTI
jgi:hypothetical protein